MTEFVGERVGHEPAPLEDERLRHDLMQAIVTMSAVLSVIESDPLRTATVMARLEQLRLQADWMMLVLGEANNQPRSMPVDVAEAVAHAWSVSGLHAMCRVRFHRERVPYAMVDPVALRRAVRNVLENAVRAAGRHGNVDVAVRRRGASVVIEVGDSGPGFGRIPQQEGLGLITVRRFVSSAGGSLTLGTSELGGALVRIEIPGVDDRTAGAKADSA